MCCSWHAHHVCIFVYYQLQLASCALILLCGLADTPLLAPAVWPLLSVAVLLLLLLVVVCVPSGMEAAIANLLEPGEKIIVGNAGIWGERVADLSARYGGE